MGFYIGQKVVCVDDGRGFPRGIVKGKIYQISGFDKCEFCGDDFLLIAGVDSGSRKNCLCNSEIRILPTNCFLADRFEPLKKETAKNESESAKAFVFNSLVKHLN